MRSEKYQRQDRIKEKIQRSLDGILTLAAGCVSKVDELIDGKIDEIIKRKENKGISADTPFNAKAYK